MKSSLFRLLAVLVVPVALVVGGCGDDDDGGSADDSADTSDGGSDQSDDATGDDAATPGLDPEFVQTFQEQLAAVGCYSGAVDGIDGPATTAAIVEFQRAQGLGEDGVVGPETEAALQTAVDAGEPVCFPAGDGTDADDGEGAMDGASEGPTVIVEGPSYGKEFTVTGCDNPSESTLSLTAEADGIVLGIDATDGVGTLSIVGGDEQDGVDLAGTVTAVSVGDAGNVSVEGTFDSDDGAPFTITGACA